MKKAILVFLLVCAGVLQAQQLTVIDFRPDPGKNDAVTFPKNDFNGDRCGLVKLRLNMFEIALEGDIVSSEFRKDEWWIYMIREANWLTIKSKNNEFVPLRCEFEDFQIDGIESDKTYVMNVELPSPPEVEDKDVAEAKGGSNSFGNTSHQSTSGRSSYSPYSYGRTMQPHTTSRTSSSNNYNNNSRTSSYSSSHASSSKNYNNSSSISSSNSHNSGSRSSLSATKASSSNSNNNSNGRSQSITPRKSPNSTSSRSASSRSSSSGSRSSSTGSSRGSKSVRGSR